MLRRFLLPVCVVIIVFLSFYIVELFHQKCNRVENTSEPAIANATQSTKSACVSVLNALDVPSLKDSLLLPDSLANMDTVLVAWKSHYRMKLYHKGKLQKTYIIGLGQEPVGHKQQQGDNRTPEGDYRIIQKSRGPFSGGYSAYLGVAWMRINYPNNADAQNGFEKGLITKAQRDAIIAANDAGKEPPKNTKLGGGIGIHGWYGKWPGEDEQDLTWGCISVQNAELDDLYERVYVGTRVVIIP